MTNDEKYKTAEERQEAFCAFCRPKMCSKCPCYSQLKGKRLHCILRWLALEAEEKKPLPCHCCGGEAAVVHSWNAEGVSVMCKKCGVFIWAHTQEEAIAAWNRRAK